MIAPNLDDAQALLARAQRHFDEFDTLVFPKDGPGLWQTQEERDPITSEWCNRLHMDRRRLIADKPIISDCATNIASALDHVTAAIARANGHDRSRQLYFPWGSTDEAFYKALDRVEPILGSAMIGVLAAVRAEHWCEIPHVEASKQISNSGKHWALMFSAGSAHGVALHIPGVAQKIFQIPSHAFADADTFEYYRGPERLPSVPQSVAVGLEIHGLDESLPRSLDSILPCSFRFVEAVIAAVAVQNASHRLSNRLGRSGRSAGWQVR